MYLCCLLPLREKLVVRRRYDSMYARPPGPHVGDQGGVGPRVHHLSMHNITASQVHDGSSVPL